MTIEEPTDIEVFALRQHILSHEQRLGKECGASLKFEHGGGKPYMGKLTDLPNRLYGKIVSITRNHWL